MKNITTLFDNIIMSLMTALLDPFAYAVLSLLLQPCMIPVPFADGGTGVCRVLEAATGLLDSCLPPLTISSTSVLKARSQLCEICAV